jgi:hypothetical protein
MDKQQEATKPVEQKDLDKVSGGYITTQNPLKPHREPKPVHGWPEPELDKVSGGAEGDAIMPRNPTEPRPPTPKPGGPQPL